MIVSATEYKWKQFIEGVTRAGNRHLYSWEHVDTAADRKREHYRNNELVASMLIAGYNAGTPSNECVRTFDIETSYIEQNKFIYIPSSYDLEIWGDADLDINEQIALMEQPGVVHDVYNTGS